MLCYSCNHKAVCKHYDYLFKNELEISQCKNYLALPIMSKGELVKPNNNNIALLSDVSHKKASRDYSKNFQSKEKTVKKTIECPSCRGIDYEDEIRICSNCMGTVCGNCSAVLDGVLLCDNCYKDGGEK